MAHVCPLTPLVKQSTHSLYQELKRPEREFSQLPITGLAFYQPPSSSSVYILAGSDTDLLVYAAAAPHRLILRVHSVLAQQPIHGIYAGVSLLVWGAASVAVLSLDGLEDGQTPVVLARGRAPDWIYDGAVLSGGASAVVVTAHNEVLPVTYDIVSEEVIFGESVSPAQTMLFSARLVVESPSSILVAAGTAFGEILVWRCHLNDKQHRTSEVLFILTGHEGSIFDVDISPPMRLRDGSETRMLASCSDDRTVRIWDITEYDGVTSKTLSDEPRETGFKPKTGEEAAPVGLVASNMGHASRIWGVRFAVARGAEDQDDVNVYSFGEDATVQRWHLNMLTFGTATDAAKGKLSPERIFSAHEGKHIWSKAIINPTDRIVIATGGADGKVCVLEESTGVPLTIDTEKGEIAVPSEQVTTLTMSDILNTLPSPKPKGPGREHVSRYDLTSQDELLAVTSLGRVLVGTFADETLNWRELEVADDVSSDLKQCYVIRAVGNGTAVLGVSNGSIYFYHPETGFSHAVNLPGKVVEMCSLATAKSDDANAYAEVIVFLHGTPNGHHLIFNPTTGSLDTHNVITGLDSRFVPVSAAKIRDLLIIGSRHGWLCVLKREEGIYRPALDFHTRTRDAITCMISLPSKSKQTKSPYFLVTSRDGKYRIYEIEEKGTSLNLRLLHETSPPVGPVIVGAWFTGDTVPDLILYGFRSKRLIVWNETRQQEMASFECGGGPHRTFSISSCPAKPDRLRFAFTKGLSLSLYAQRAISQRVVKDGTHGREIRALSFNGRYLATGAEDASIRLWEYQEGETEGEPQLRCLAYLKLHVSGLQRLQWLGDDYLFSSAGNEEFLVWRVQRLEADIAGLAVLCESVFEDKSADGDLRIMDFDVSRSETDTMVITLAYSNSALKTYQYTTESGFILAAEVRYTGACLTQARHIDMRGEDLTVLTASTDGHLALWRTEAGEGGVRRHVLEQVERLHQSSIKGFDMVRIGDDYRVLTGGDDNALGTAWVVQSLQDETCRRYTISARGIVRRAHAAAINGVVMKQLGDTDVVGVSVSNDQRVKTWRLPERGSGKVELLEDVYSGVADPSDVCLVDNGKRVAVGGVGLEMWRMQE